MSSFRRILPVLALLGAFLCAPGCGGDVQGADETEPSSPPERAPEKAAERVPGVTYAENGEPAGLHRYHRWSEKIGQGAQPEGEVAFRNLYALGYRTILSVDGSLPDVESAEKHGLRYVHVPIGYDGIDATMAAKIVKAARLDDAPIFVHCHHGKHRGPAAAMLCRMSEDKVSAEVATKGLEASGTSPNYAGLWRDVKAFQVPSAEAIAAVGELPSRVQPEGLRAGMVHVSHRWEYLKLAQASGWKKALADHPDISPAHEARMLWEQFREMARTDKECKDKGDIFLKYLAASEQAAIELETALRAEGEEAARKAEAEKRYKAVKNLCVDCHRDYRN
jgi:protein tyrosine phosphatase (PTP) superfamily phosphohydrolase (DUF442 family)